MVYWLLCPSFIRPQENYSRSNRQIVFSPSWRDWTFCREFRHLIGFFFLVAQMFLHNNTLLTPISINLKIQSLGYKRICCLLYWTLKPANYSASSATHDNPHSCHLVSSFFFQVLLLARLINVFSQKQQAGKNDAGAQNEERGSQIDKRDGLRYSRLWGINSAIITSREMLSL